MDRGRESNKDAADLYRFLTTYADAGNTDRLYDCDGRMLHQVQSVLAEDGNRERLVIDMVRTSTYAEETPFVERTLSASGRGLRRNGVSSEAD